VKRKAIVLNSSYPILRRALFTLEPERAHAAALSALETAHSLGVIRAPSHDPATATTLLGLRFPNRVGLAAGFDKNARCIDALGALGFGFIEVGTVTPRPQAGQAKPRLFRLVRSSALINRMGFPNEGASAVAARLAQRTFQGVCGVNIGKNAATPIAEALHDYLECFRILAPLADYVAINVSSPNTANLRQLQRVDQLQPILEALLEAREGLHLQSGRRVPLLVKISPDLSEGEVGAIAGLIRALGVDGVIATNTTSSRPLPVGEGSASEPFATQEGGLSGAPLLPLMLRTVRALRVVLGPTVPVIAVGGVDCAERALDVMRAGADLIQVYTGLIYRGPALIGQLAAALRRP
jgi:dihydroorotate dehydrogenase